MLKLLMFSFPGIHRNTDDSILGIQTALIVFICGALRASVQAHVTCKPLIWNFVGLPLHKSREPFPPNLGTSVPDEDEEHCI